MHFFTQLNWTVSWTPLELLKDFLKDASVLGACHVNLAKDPEGVFHVAWSLSMGAQSSCNGVFTTTPAAVQPYQ